MTTSNYERRHRLDEAEAPLKHQEFDDRLLVLSRVAAAAARASAAKQTTSVGQEKP